MAERSSVIVGPLVELLLSALLCLKKLCNFGSCDHAGQHMHTVLIVWAFIASGLSKLQANNQPNGVGFGDSP